MNDLVMRILTITAMSPNDLCGELYWRVDGEYAPITFLLDCSDTFHWATADCEPLTEHNIHILEKAVADIRAISPSDVYWAPELFAARVRRMRPMQAAYPRNPALRPLFDTCGPPRDV